MQFASPQCLVLGGLLAASVSMQAQAVPPVKPGLWEVNFQREVDGQKALSPNEQAERLTGEERLKLQSMVRRGVVAGDHKAQMCLSADLLSSSRWHGSDASCTVKYSQQNSSAWRWHASCPNYEADGQVAFDGPLRYVQTVTSRTSGNGVSHIVKVRSVMVWQSPDCSSPH